MKFTISRFALVLFITSASSMMISQVTFAESPVVYAPEDSSEYTVPEGSNEDTETLNPTDGVEEVVDNCDDCEIPFEYDGLDPQIYQTTGGPEVQHDNSANPKPRAAIVYQNDSFDGLSFHEIMRKKRRAARSN